MRVGGRVNFHMEKTCSKIIGMGKKNTGSPCIHLVTIQSYDNTEKNDVTVFHTYDRCYLGHVIKI